MANLKNVIYLSNEDYETLVSTGTVTIEGQTLTYDENNVYITPDKLASQTEDGLMSAADKSKLDGLDDSNLVHKTGNETIIGAKTFSVAPTFSQGLNMNNGQATFQSQGTPITVSTDQNTEFMVLTAEDQGGSVTYSINSASWDQGDYDYTLTLPAASGTIALTKDVSNITWTNGTTAGPTGTLTAPDGSTTSSIPAIPSASDTQSGVVTTGDQVFIGQKEFSKLDDGSPIKIDFDNSQNYALKIYDNNTDYTVSVDIGGQLDDDIDLRLPVVSGTLVVQGKTVIQKVNNEQVIPNEELGLFRFTETVSGITQSSHVFEVAREDHGAEEVTFEKITETNNTSLTTTTFMNQFNPSLAGLLSISATSSVYTLRYAYDGDTVENGIRFGTSSAAGSITITTTKECDITFKWYYSYNGSTGEVVSYDTASKVIIDGVDHTFTNNTTPLTVTLAAGTHTISSYFYKDPETSEKTIGRIILSSFEFIGEPYSIWSKNALARVSEVEAVNTRVANHETTTHNRFVEDERNIATNTNNITEINSKLGTIQAFQAGNNLPTPSSEYLNKIYRKDGEFYQCVKSGDGVQKEWTFANVAGTSEITSSNVDSFYGDAGNQFNTYLDVDYNGTTKFYRNAGSLKLGSSSATGNVEFRATTDAQNLPITSLKFGLKAYNTNGSTVLYEVEFVDEDETDYQYVSGTVFLSDNTTETLFDLSSEIPSGYRLSYLDISSVAQHNTGSDEEPVMVNNDKRLVITKLAIDLGEITYAWSNKLVDTESDQEINGEKTFTNAVKVSDKLIGEEDENGCVGEITLSKSSSTDLDIRYKDADNGNTIGAISITEDGGDGGVHEVSIHAVDTSAQNTGAINLNASNILINGRLANDYGEKGLVLPDASSWSDDKIIATTDDIPEQMTQAQFDAATSGVLPSQVWSVVDIIYPVGSIYTSITQIEATKNIVGKMGCPIAEVGGTWERVEGKFLLSADTSHAASTTGGAASYTLTENNIPQHSHGYSITTDAKTVTGSTGSSSPRVLIDLDGDIASDWAVTEVGGGTDYTSHYYIKSAQGVTTGKGTLFVNSHSHSYNLAVGGQTASGNTGNYGKSSGTITAVSTMPPYLSVYMWKRTA